MIVPGIPDRTVKTNPRLLTKPELWSFNVQQHDAQKAGRHFDLRLVDPQSGIAHSWAVRSLPALAGEKVLAVQQPDHTGTYSTWEGKIESGYGAGTVKLFSSDKIEITKSDPDHVLFNVYKSTGDTDRYALIHTGGNDWLFFNVTPTKVTRPEMNIEKPKYKSVSPDSIDVNNPKQVLAPKFDGALNAFVLRKGKPVEVYSYRPSKKGPAKLIDHSFRTELYKTVTPESLRGKTVLLGELFAKDPNTGRVMSSRDTSARLLSNVWRSRELQKTGPLDNVVFDVLRYQGKDTRQLPYSEKLKLLAEITKEVPGLKLPPMATDPTSKHQLLSEIRSGIHPLSQEGVVVYDVDKSVPLKAKLFKDYDVQIQKIFPGQGKYQGRGAGGFVYTYPNTDKIVGRVGSGFTDQLRKDMYAHPKKYEGIVARVLAQEQLPSGALRTPVFKDIRSETWPREKKADYLPAAQPSTTESTPVEPASPRLHVFRAGPDKALMHIRKGSKAIQMATLNTSPPHAEAPIPPSGDNVLTYMPKASALDWKHMSKEYILPSLVAGPIIGAGVTALTSANKEDFNKNLTKGIGAGIAIDLATGLSMGLWNQRKSLKALFKKTPLK
jgi:hypothetical protein